MAADNMSLGRFKLQGIPPARRGVPQIEVTFDIDANGIVSVSAKDLGTGQTQQVTITGGTALDQADIEQMIKDAESHASQDAERKAAAEARNAADHAVHTVGSQLAEHGDKLTEDDKEPIQANLDALKTVLEDKDATTESLTSATTQLLQSAQVIGQKMYEAAQAEAASAEGASEDAPASDDEVVEAEVVDEEDES